MSSHRKSFRKLCLSSGHRRSFFANMASSLILHGRIHTTTQKAKELRPVVEKLVTKAINKRSVDDLHIHRQLISKLRNKNAVKSLMERAIQMKDRNGGYIRIIKTDPRKGDNANMSIIEFVEFLPQDKILKDDATSSSNEKKLVSN